MSDKQIITEEMGIHKEWYIEANDMTVDKLESFVKRLVSDYEHDYGTICHAITAAGLAAMHAVDHSDQGGITGFQGSAIMWQFIQEWRGIKGGAKLLQYDNMLYPQYSDMFDKVIKPSIWKDLQEKAALKLSSNNDGFDATEYVKQHWQSIVDGIVPFGCKVVGDE